MKARMIPKYVSRVFLFAQLLSCIGISKAQDVKRCGTTEMTKKIMVDFPQIHNASKVCNLEIQEYIKDHNTKKKAACSNILVIPTVFHIIHENGIENITDAKVSLSNKLLPMAVSNRGVDLCSRLIFWLNENCATFVFILIHIPSTGFAVSVDNSV